MVGKFKVGDKIIATSASYPIKIGDKFTVTLVKGMWLGFNMGNGKYPSNPDIENGTKENWGEGLFKLDTESMKEIVGYNIKKEYQDNEQNIADALDCSTGLDSGDVWLSKDSATYIERAKKLAVLDLWFEPVYKQSEIVVQLSKSRTATINSATKASINIDGKFDVTNIEVSNLLVALNTLAVISGYKATVKEFQLGCQTFTIADLQTVAQAFKDFK